MGVCPIEIRPCPPMYPILAVLATVTYLAAGLRIARYLAHPPPERPARDMFACVTVGCGVVLHAASLWPALTLWSGANPDLPTTISLAGLTTTTVFGIALIWRIDPVVGALVLPLAAVAPLVPMAWSGQDIPVGATSTHVHAAISVLTWAVLSLAALQALLLAWQEHRLRTRRPGGALRTLASLGTQERWLFRLVGAGFFLLSLSLASGFMFVQDMFAQHLVHKTALSCLAWAMFGALLWGRWRHGWRGQTAARWCLSGFVVLALAYFGSRLILEVLLDQRWYSA